MIANVEDLIKALGGTDRVGDLCGGIGKTAISHWRVQNRIPDRHKFRLFRLCEEAGLDVSAALFEQSAA